MKKNKFIKLLVIVFGLFLTTSFGIVNAFDFKTVCQSPLTTFSDGNFTFPISFPPGGGTNSDAKIKLSQGATVYSVKVDMVSATGVEVGTPYIWIPVTSEDEIKQIDTDNCNVIETYSLGIGTPSRTFVMPGGDVWVASREGTKVAKLSPLTGSGAVGSCGDGTCGTDETIYSCPADCSGPVCEGSKDCRKYKVIGGFTTGTTPKGVTGGADGNIWVGNCGSGTVSKLDPKNWPTSKLITDISVGGCPYGMMGDPYGHIWISNRGTSLQCLETSTGTFKSVYTVNKPYGIGMDKDGGIYLACYECGTVLKFDAVTSSACPSSMTPLATFDTGQTSGTRGVAIDQSGNVWTANSGNDDLYVFTSPTSKYNVEPSGATNLIGVAIDANGYGWAVDYDKKVAYKYSFSGGSFNLECTTPNLGGNLYNYSDMTGLRTTPKSLTFGGTKTLLSGDTFTICSDGATTCSDSTPCAALTLFLSTCSADALGDCEIPLKIFSIQPGDYTLKNLEVIYGKEVPVTIGGLVPCGREWDDPSTPLWNETKPCNFCYFILMINNIMNFLMMLASGVAVLFLIITGLLFVISSGDTERKNQAKTAAKYVIIGFVIILISWIIVDFLLAGWGYLDPLGGEWNVVNCDVDTSVVVVPPTATFCGDGAVQSPNDAGTGGPANKGFEECDIDGSSCGSLVCNADCTCKTEPTPGVCGVWFSGGFAGKPPGPWDYYTAPFELMDNDEVPSQLAEWVGSGNYPDNSIAFPIAVLRSFDGIAIDKNTRLELWDGKNYKNLDGTTNPIFDITGPAIINNINGVNGGYTVANCFFLDTTYWTNCQLSTGDMNPWGDNGSCKITCTAP